MTYEKRKSKKGGELRIREEREKKEVHLIE